ncbi:MAG: hypothetical protein OEM99_11855 [Gammaproteobacteria bacterium]|nr:hypothetical protein [Gammaproteobacteria bacterium]
MSHANSRRTFWVVTFALGVIAVTGIHSGATTRFELNDDWLIADILSGRFTGSCQAHVLYVHIWLARALAWLYCTIPSIEWYVVCLLFCHALALAGFGLIVLDQNAPRLSMGLSFTVLTVVFIIPKVLVLTYTTAAAILAASGMLLVLGGLQKPNTARGQVTLGLCYLGVATLVRPEAFALILVLALPGLVQCAMKGRSAKTGTTLLLILAIGGGFTWIHQYEYQSDASWSETLHYSRARVAVHDSFAVKRRVETGGQLVENTFSEVGWTQNDADLFFDWVYFDRALYSIESLEIIRARLAPSAPESTWNIEGWIKSAKQGLWDLISLSQENGMLMQLFVCLALIVTSLRNRAATWWACVSALWVALVFVGIAIALKLPTRVVSPGLLYLTGSILVTGAPLAKFHSKALRHGTGIGLLALLTIGLVDATLVERRNQHLADEYYQVVSPLESRKDLRVFVWPSAIPLEFAPVRANEDPRERAKIIRIGGWQTGTPLQQKQFGALGVADPLRALVDDNEAILVSSPTQANLALIYLSEHHGIWASAEEFLTTPRFSVFRLVTSR